MKICNHYFHEEDEIIPLQVSVTITQRHYVDFLVYIILASQKLLTLKNNSTLNEVPKFLNYYVS